MKNLRPEDYKNLLHAVLFSQKLMERVWKKAAGKFSTRPLSKNNLIQKRQEEWQRAVDHGNSFLYTFMKQDEKLKDLPLNTEDFHLLEGYSDFASSTLEEEKRRSLTARPAVSGRSFGVWPRVPIKTRKLLPKIGLQRRAPSLVFPIPGKWLNASTPSGRPGASGSLSALPLKASPA